jgi:hypothetical protein
MAEAEALAEEIAGLRFAPAEASNDNACGNEGIEQGASAESSDGRAQSALDTTGLYRLKVVNLPRSLSEKDLVDLFSTCGTVFEARVVYDKASGLPVGYGYVSFGSKDEADLAISKLDGQLQLDGAPGRLSVYYAKKQHTLKESSPARNAKLYFCGTPAGCKREAILSMFSAFGRVRHLQVYVDSMGGLSSGTVTMFTTTEANAAMEALDGMVLSEGTAPLKVSQTGNGPWDLFLATLYAHVPSKESFWIMYWRPLYILCIGNCWLWSCCLGEQLSSCVEGSMSLHTAPARLHWLGSS